MRREVLGPGVWGCGLPPVFLSLIPSTFLLPVFLGLSDLLEPSLLALILFTSLKNALSFIQIGPWYSGEVALYADL